MNTDEGIDLTCQVLPSPRIQQTLSPTLTLLNTFTASSKMILYLALQTLKIRLKARFKQKCGFKAQCIGALLQAPSRFRGAETAACLPRRVFHFSLCPKPLLCELLHMVCHTMAKTGLRTLQQHW
ncbi:uncharacterized protein M8220_003334 isoform 1-T4 [Acridotheres tristis]